MRIKDSFIEERAIEYLALSEISKNCTFIDYLEFCWSLNNGTTNIH